MGCGVSALCEETGPFLVNFQPLAELHDCLLLLVFLLKADIKVDGWKKIDGSSSVTYSFIRFVKVFSPSCPPVDLVALVHLIKKNATSCFSFAFL